MKKQSCFTVINREDYIRFVTACAHKGIDIDGTRWDFDLHSFAFLVDWDKMTCRNDPDWSSKGQDIVLYTPDSFLIEYNKSILYTKNKIDRWMKDGGPEGLGLEGAHFYINGNRLYCDDSYGYVEIAEPGKPIDESILAFLAERIQREEPELADDLERG